jgi:hypothetical protein
MGFSTFIPLKRHSAASRNQGIVTTDFTDFADKKDRFPIRDIREISGQTLSRTTSAALGKD